MNHVLQEIVTKLGKEMKELEDIKFLKQDAEKRIKRIITEMRK